MKRIILCAFKCSNSAKREYLRFHGIFKREKHVNDLGQTSRIAK